MDISSLGMAALLRRQPETRHRVLMADAPFLIKSFANVIKSKPFSTRSTTSPMGRAGSPLPAPALMHYSRSEAARATSNAPNYVATLVNDYRAEVADANSGSIRASGFTMSSASLFSSSFASDSSSKVCWRSSADLSCPSNCAKVRTLP